MPHAALTDLQTTSSEGAKFAAVPTASGRVLAEAIRILEERLGRPFEDGGIAASVAADCRDGDLEERIVERARRLPQASAINEAADHVAAAVRISLVIACVLAMILGGLAARAMLSDGTASVAGLLFGVLGIQTLLLVAWLAWLPARSRFGSAGFLGRLVLGSGRWIGRRFSHGQNRASVSAAASAMAMVHGRGSAGLWSFSAVSHGLWSAFNAGGLIVLAALFLGEGYQFRWDSTWLSAETYRQLIAGLALAPEVAGFNVPNDQQIESSRIVRGMTLLSNQDVATREAWSWFFFGAVVVYGLLPRLILLGLSLLMRQRALSRARLDLSRPGFAVLRARLSPEAQIAPSLTGGGGGETAGFAMIESPPAARSQRPGGPPSIVGLEMAVPSSGWPPRITSKLHDLGIIDGRDDARRALSELAGSATAPSPLLIVAEFERSPDRGVERLIADLRRAAGGATHLILTGGRDMAQHRSQDVIARRAEDWRSLAQSAGLIAHNVLEIDLDHLTDTTRAALDQLARGGPAAREPSRDPQRIQEAFQAIERRALEWKSGPSDRELIALHADISRTYGHESRTWGAAFAADLVERVKSGTNLSTEAAIPALRSAAESIRSLLPPSLASQGKWITAGGVAGALGCLAVALTMAPAAAAALPMWALLGAAIAAATGASARRSGPVAEPHSSEEKFDDAVRGAALFALVLELQGRGEAIISQILDRTLEASSHDISPARLPAWLDEVRRRFDRALREEEASA